MHAVEFEADIKDSVIELPKEHSDLESKHVRVIVLVDDVKKDEELDFSKFRINSFEQMDAVEYQRKLRDEW